jgi:hypothetical protein
VQLPLSGRRRLSGAVVYAQRPPSVQLLASARRPSEGFVSAQRPPSVQPLASARRPSEGFVSAQRPPSVQPLASARPRFSTERWAMGQALTSAARRGAAIVSMPRVGMPWR